MITPSTKLFALTYLGSVFGEASTVFRSGTGVAFCQFKHGSDYVVKLTDNGIWISDDIPQDRYYQLIGYCKIHGVPVLDNA